eukprot:116139_1
MPTLTRNNVLLLVFLVCSSLVACTLIIINFQYINIDNILYNQKSQHNVTNLLNTKRRSVRQHNDLSFIIASRNDNYGIKPHLRLRYVLQNLVLYNWNKFHDLSVQIVIIEWNSVNINPHIWEYSIIRDLLDYKSKSNYINNIQILFYVIPPFYNDIIPCGSDVYCPFYEFHAKNAGLRRSTGTWKVIMNIDDLWGINLLRFIGNSIQQNTLDKHGIYQAMQNQADILHNKTMRKQLKNMQFTDIGSVMNHPFENNITMCVNVFSGPWNLKGSGGDFILIHNQSLYNFYGGGFVETCSNSHLDSEFIMRSIHINKLNPYVINNKCSYYHIRHIPQRHTRNLNRTFIQIKNLTKEQIKKKKIKCDGPGGGLYTYNFINKHLQNSTNWVKAYQLQHENWGIKTVDFTPLAF